MNVSIYILLGGTGALSVSLNTLMPCGTPDPQPSTTPSPSPSPSSTKASTTPTGDFATRLLAAVNKHLVYVANCPELRYSADLDELARKSVRYWEVIPPVDWTKTGDDLKADQKRFGDASMALQIAEEKALPGKVTNLGYVDSSIAFGIWGGNDTEEEMARQYVNLWIDRNKAKLDSCHFTAMGASAIAASMMSVILAKD